MKAMKGNQMPEQTTSCRSEDGKTVGGIDAIIAMVRFLVDRDMSSEEVQHALADLFEDSDFAKIQAARTFFSPPDE
ncbi:hypothetical protein QFZ75_008011 [Streptomyces sp. V3I8]|uniref:hypothetical protein n=1 Tax=Streptomyces sp. V3I8 TaxID=3042279 RepID=UPI002781C350|nr:hypothetical protein [Streptomyces sp. V3I8]MDQ1041509.1 hypothetical protein [Streptomyces sp. V3I8]